MTETRELVRRLLEKDKPLMQQGNWSSIRAVIREAADALEAHAEENRRLREALTHGLSFAESWVDEHGGIDGCEMHDRISLEKIRAALVGGRE